MYRQQTFWKQTKHFFNVSVFLSFEYQKKDAKENNLNFFQMIFCSQFKPVERGATDKNKKLWVHIENFLKEIKIKNILS